MIDILAPYCELVSDCGMRGRVGGTSVTIRKYNVILMSRLREFAHKLPVQNRYNSQNMSIITHTFYVTLPALHKQKETHCSLFLHLWLKRDTSDPPWDLWLWPLLQTPKMLFQLLLAMRLYFLVLCHPSTKYLWRKSLKSIYLNIKMILLTRKSSSGRFSENLAWTKTEDTTWWDTEVKIKQ